MRKLTYHILIVFAALLAVTSCSEDLEQVQLGDISNVTPPEILSPEPETVLTLDLNAPDETAMTVQWKKIDYGTNLSVDYTVEIATAGSNFANPVELGVSVTNSFSITNVELNNKLLTLGFSPNAEGQFELRIRTSVNYQIPETISEAVALTGIPYFDPSVLPENLYMTGASLNAVGDGGWNWDTNYSEFKPVHSHPELFWTIVWLDPTVQDAGVKIAPQRAWVGDFAVQGDPTDGVWEKGTSNLIVPEAGYYTVVVNYIAGTVEANPTRVYGIGNVFGSWDSANPQNLFTIDKTNKLVKFEGTVNGDELRMHVAANTLVCDWWQAEFIILNGQIVYRGTGDDQERVQLTSGNATINLNFMNDTGSIVQ
ncbi:SusE domain-containing protein [Mangrovibacterium marinum]|uniref:Uncharacterized protein DUF5019 n=1 Tax=Mangrovibacterium marinum TaxID=1639118 RepID=A0A2T5C0N4_9BACT|nr:SusE domain-containing protein [Mangrovibacterium marinum]PTN08151.1 uncharacterized protein DUF5019 [Mangrovibacterium marinum]